MKTLDILGLDDAWLGTTLFLPVDGFNEAASLLGKTRSELLDEIGFGEGDYDDWVKAGVPFQVMETCTKMVEEAGKTPKDALIVTTGLYFHPIHHIIKMFGLQYHRGEWSA
jgi:hypothetical protein